MKRTLIIITVIISAALVALLAYSVERSSWFLSMYEIAGTKDDSTGPSLALAAAIVAELAAIALIIGEGAIRLLDEKTAQRLAHWAGIGLLAVLTLQGVGGLIAGYTRGSGRMLTELGSGNEYARFAVASVALLLGNLTVPALILALSKIAALLVQTIVALPKTIDTPAPVGRLMPAIAHAADTPISTARISIPTEALQASNIGIAGIVDPIADRACPRCHRGLTAGQFGAAKRYGYCKACKG